MTVSAPGKIFLLGEYAVLEGGRALVAAVDRRAFQSNEGTAVSAPSPVIQAVLDVAEERGHARAAPPPVDVSAFLDAHGRKLGLGASAAEAVVTAAWATGSGDEHTLQIAVEGHRRAAGGLGSGVDVAASFSGGVIAAKKQPSEIVPLSSRIRGLETFVLYTRESVSTRSMITACTQAPRYRAHVGVLRDLAEEGIDAWQRQDAMRFLSVVARFGRAMAALGRDAGVPVVTEQMEQIMDQAGARGAAAKPSGAGGGDVVVMFAPARGIAEDVAAATGAELLEIAIDPAGLRRRPS